MASTLSKMDGHALYGLINIFTVEGDLPKEELISIAQNLKQK